MLNIKTVGVFNDADKNSKHVSMVDEACYIGSNVLADSYLNQERILDVAKRYGAQAIHPGYGFLSENEKFVEWCEWEGITFIGPPSKAILSMGNKREAKVIMGNAKVPIVPGYHGTE